MPPSLLARLPNIPAPPRHGTFASFSAFTLLSLLCVNRLPQHPYVIVAWAGGSYLLNTYWLKLKLKQVTATVIRQVDNFLKNEGACEECRRNVAHKGPNGLAQLLEDLKKIKDKELADLTAERENAVAERGETFSESVVAIEEVEQGDEEAEVGEEEVREDGSEGGGSGEGNAVVRELNTAETEMSTETREVI